MGKTLTEVELVKAPAPCTMALYSLDEFCEYWPQIEEMLDCVPHTWRRWTKASIYDAVIDGRMQVWGIGPGNVSVMVIITMVSVFPAMRVLTLFWTGGTLTPDMHDLVERTFVTYARIQRCDEMEVLGRSGWEPILRKHGFRKDGVMLTRPVMDIHLH